MLANEFLLPSVEGFTVGQRDEFPTHSPIRVKIATKKLVMQKRKLRKPDSAAEAIQRVMEEKTKDLIGKELSQAKKDVYGELHGCMIDEISMRRHRLSQAQAECDSNKL